MKLLLSEYDELASAKSIFVMNSQGPTRGLVSAKFEPFKGRSHRVEDSWAHSGSRDRLSERRMVRMQQNHS